MIVSNVYQITIFVLDLSIFQDSETITYVAPPSSRNLDTLHCPEVKSDRIK